MRYKIRNDVSLNFEFSNKQFYTSHECVNMYECKNILNCKNIRSLPIMNTKHLSSPEFRKWRHEIQGQKLRFLKLSSFRTFISILIITYDCKRNLKIQKQSPRIWKMKICFQTYCTIPVSLYVPVTCRKGETCIYFRREHK